MKTRVVAGMARRRGRCGGVVGGLVTTRKALQWRWRDGGDDDGCRGRTGSRDRSERGSDTKTDVEHARERERSSLGEGNADELWVRCRRSGRRDHSREGGGALATLFKQQHTRKRERFRMQRASGMNSQRVSSQIPSPNLFLALGVP